MAKKITGKEGILIDKQGRKIPFCSWMPSKTLVQLVLIHGFSEHMRYYFSAAENLCAKGIAVHMMDLPGHGAAEGIRGHIDDFQEYVDNIDLILNENPNFLKTKPVYLLGHSLGALISVHYCFQKRFDFKGLILCSPLTGFQMPGSIPVIMMAHLLSRKKPDHPYPKPTGVKDLCRNPKQWKVYFSDPYRVRTITPSLYLSMESKTHSLQDNAATLQLPLLVFSSVKDTIVSPDAVRRFLGNVGSADKTAVFFTEAMHELFQEEEKDQMLDKIHAWIMERI